MNPLSRRNILLFQRGWIRKKTSYTLFLSLGLLELTGLPTVADSVVTYEARTLLRLGVSRCRTRVLSDIDICNYIELCDFFKLLAVLACQCRVRCLCLYPCFIGCHCSGGCRPLDEDQMTCIITSSN